MEVNVNLLGSATSKGWQKDDQMSSGGARGGGRGGEGAKSQRAQFHPNFPTDLKLQTDP